MQSLDEIPDFGKRVKGINLGWKRLARLAGVDPSTAWRAITGKSDPRGSTIRKLNDALAAEEKKVREHFAELDGKTSNQQEDQAA